MDKKKNPLPGDVWNTLAPDKALTSITTILYPDGVTKYQVCISDEKKNTTTEIDFKTLQDNKRFNEVVGEKIGYILRPYKNSLWRRIVNGFLLAGRSIYKNETKTL